MSDEVKIHPLNAKGKYYIDQNACTWSAACQEVAPRHIKKDENDSSIYVAKQPESPEEEELMKEAMYVCPMEAIRDDGDQ